MKIAIYGGSFDPIHLGHEMVIRHACRAFDHVIVVPAFWSPGKKQPSTKPHDRLEMVMLSLQGQQKVSVCEYEMEKQRTSYTIDTLRFIQQNAPHHEFFLLVGIGWLTSFTSWKEASEIQKMVNIMFIADESYQKEIQQQHPQEKFFFIPWVDVSSTQIRSYRKKGKSIVDFVNPRVYQYIMKNNLYSSFL